MNRGDVNAGFIEQIAQIVDIRLREVQERLLEKSVKLQVTPDAKQLIVDKGYDPILGARPLQRSIQRLVEDRLAEEFLNDRFHDGETIEIGRNDEELTFSTVQGSDETT